MKKLGCLVIASCFLYLCSSFAQPKLPQRIISGIPSITEMLYALNLEDKIVGVTTNCNYPPAAQKKEKIGGFFLNLEKIVFLKPDLILMLEDAQKNDIKKLKSRGLPVYTFNPRTVNDVMKSIVELGKMSDKEIEAKQLVKQMKKRIDKFRPRFLSLEFILRRPRVLAIVGVNPIIVAGGDTFIDDIIKCAGGRNIAESSKVSYPQYNIEALLRENPDYIIITAGTFKQKEIEADRRFENLEAVRKKHILEIESDILSRPGPRVVEAVEKIARMIHATKS